MSVRLRVRLTPKASADRIDGLARDADGTPLLHARVRAAPEDGAANAALETLLARSFGTPRSRVRVTRGATSRIKLVEFEDLTPGALSILLAKVPDKPA